ncbi:glycosyltransferase [Planococcus glaciei]|uniref:Glycosyltransferase n=1 Tax=Planococcus glaciei TaxID=459472 RepID=A0A7H8Q8A1_9BACL|nr:hypothetical protein G159_16685 [Planococcus glaciei CHR43]QKX49483.1 glycosyltransferase [Planococcus glaciei]
MKCLESVISQKGFQEYEVIVVNDGTQDRSIERIQTIVKSHRNIHLIEQENGGLSEARNTGIRSSKGEYISFVDSDDWIDSTMIFDLYQAIVQTGSDIAVCNMKKVFADKTGLGFLEMKSGFSDRTVMSSKEAINHYFNHKKINGYACNKIYNRRLFSDYNITFPGGKSYEDLPTTFRLLWHSKKIVFLEGCFYNYLQREGSISNKLHTNLWDMIENVYFIQSFLKSNGSYKDYQKKIAQLLIFHLFRIHIELQKNKGALNYEFLKGKLNQEIADCSFLKVMANGEINFLTKIKFVSMKIKADYLIDFLLKAKAYKSRVKTVGS